MSTRRVIRLLGTLVLVLGVALLAWGFATWKWGDPVTGVYTSWEQRGLASTYDRIEERFSVPPRTASESGKPRQAVGAAAERFRRAIQEGQPIGRIVAPRLGLDMVMVDGTESGTLKRGPGRDRRTFMPGEGELVYIAGHRTTYGAPFAHIDRLRRGDRIVLEMPYAKAVYRVTNHVIVPSDDLDRLKTTGTELVALQACHPRFSASKRYIVYGKLASLTPVRSSSGSTPS
jgi:sortase A